MWKVSFGGKKNAKTFQRPTRKIQNWYEICEISFFINWKIKEAKMGETKNRTTKVASYHRYWTKNSWDN